MRFRLLEIAGLIVLGLFGSPVDATVFVGPVFRDHMVIQHGKPVEVWGSANPGEKVKVSFAGQNLVAETNAGGRWRIALAPLAIDRKGKDMIVQGPDNTVTYRDILVGDVWLCSGQSNMEMSFEWGVLDGGRFIRESANPLIRHMKVRKRKSNVPEESVYIDQEWQVCSPQTLPGLSAAAYFFALELSKHIDIPIGLIDDSWSGCRIEPFFNPAGLAGEPGLAYIQKEMDACDPRTPEGKRSCAEIMNRIQQWYDRAISSAPGDPVPGDSPTFPNLQTVSYRQPTTQYNAMIYPLTNFPLKGIIWYQGCGNNGDPDYLEKMRALIAGWRLAWKDELPFYFVQLAAFGEPASTPAGGNGFAGLRQQQLQTLSVPNTGMAVAIDIGQANDIHPKNKYDVGKRLALAALNKTYGLDIPCSGPLFKAMKVEGSQIRLWFDQVNGGLTAGEKRGMEPVKFIPDKKLNNFAIGDENGKWAWAEARIDGETVVVSSPEIANPVHVRFAYCGYPEKFNFYNAAGLPASPFRTDQH